MVNLSDIMEEDSLENRTDMYLNALRSFTPDQSDQSTTTHPELLEDYLRSVAKTGRPLFDWSTIRRFILHKLTTVMRDMRNTAPYDESVPIPNTDYFNGDVYMERISRAVESFDGIPFTIQRLAELLTNPKKHYKRADKFFRALEKNVTIVTTVGPDGDRDTTVYDPSPPVALLNGKSSEETVILSGETTPSISSGEELSMEDISGSPRPMPSIETLWETTASRSNAEDLPSGDHHPISADTSLDNLRPSISECLIDGTTDDILSKESFWPVVTSSTTTSVSGKYPSDQFVTMTPLQVPQLSSSSPTNNDTHLLTDTSAANVYCSLPSVGLTFGDFDEDPTTSLGGLSRLDNNKECSTEVTTTTSSPTVAAIACDSPPKTSNSSPILAQSSVEIFVSDGNTQESCKDLADTAAVAKSAANTSVTPDLKGLFVEADSTDPNCSSEPPRKMARLSNDEKIQEDEAEIPLPVSESNQETEIQENMEDVEDKPS